MKQKGYVVTVAGMVCVDTTVAVWARSPEEARGMALEGVACDIERWMRHPDLLEGPSVCDVSEGDWSDLEFADQKHLLPTECFPSA